MYNQLYENICTMKCMHNENNKSVCSHGTISGMKKNMHLQSRYNIRNGKKYAFAFHKQKEIRFSISESHELTIDNDP